jgi:hypothetical protein
LRPLAPQVAGSAGSMAGLSAGAAPPAIDGTPLDGRCRPHAVRSLFQGRLRDPGGTGGRDPAPADAARVRKAHGLRCARADGLRHSAFGHAGLPAVRQLRGALPPRRLSEGAFQRGVVGVGLADGMGGCSFPILR